MRSVAGSTIFIFARKALRVRNARLEESAARRRGRRLQSKAARSSTSSRLHAKPIRRTAVIGAGVMGSGIAAHFANAGLEVLLLDIVPPGLSDADDAGRTRTSATASRPAASRRRCKARPAAFFHKDNARLVSRGQHRGRPRQAEGLRPRHRGDHREDGGEAGPPREAREDRPRALHRRVQHVGPRIEEDDEGPLGER